MDISNEQYNASKKGRAKSGRFWKTDKKKFSSMTQVKPLKSSWETKMKLRNEHKLFKAKMAEINEIKQKEIQDRKQRRAEKIKRKKENERKAEVVQVIRNTKKLKKMSKKKLRQISKRDTN